jgi:hypothetical protein
VSEEVDLAREPASGLEKGLVGRGLKGYELGDGLSEAVSEDTAPDTRECLRSVYGLGCNWAATVYRLECQTYPPRAHSTNKGLRDIGRHLPS